MGQLLLDNLGKCKAWHHPLGSIMPVATAWECLVQLCFAAGQAAWAGRVPLCRWLHIPGLLGRGHQVRPATC